MGSMKPKKTWAQRFRAETLLLDRFCGPAEKTPSRIDQDALVSMSEGTGTAIKLVAAVLVTSAILSGCGHFRPIEASPCAGWRQINPTAGDVEVISDPLAGQILSHNMHGAAVCAWVPPTKKAD